MAEEVVITAEETAAGTLPIARVQMIDKDTGTATDVDLRTCARGVTCDENKTLQQHLAEIHAHMEDESIHLESAPYVRAIHEVTIPAEDWELLTVEEGDSFAWGCTLAVEGADAMLIPQLALLRSSLPEAYACELCPTAETVYGGVRLWARHQPTADMVGTLTLYGEGGAAQEAAGGS